MAPLNHPIEFLERSTNTPAPVSASPSEASLSLGTTVGIAVAIAFVCSFALASLVYFYYTRQRRPTVRQHRENWLDADVPENGRYGMKALAPRLRPGRVLSVFFPSTRRKPRGVLHTQSSRSLRDGSDSPSRQLPDKQFEDLREPAVELAGGLVADTSVPFGAEVNRSLSPFEDARRQVEYNGPVPPYTSASKSEQDVSSTGHYRFEDNPAPPSVDFNNMIITMPSSTDATAPAAWHRKRTGPPPPLTIEPPGMHSRSPSDAHSAYSTYATTRSPYEYCSINVPSVPPLPTHIANDGFGTLFANEGANSIHSSNSNRSSLPLQYPPSPQTPGSIPSMSRSDSGAQESCPLAPPTPTYSLPRSQPSSQRANLIDATHFECLGPLPDHIPIPSPPYFRTQHQQQQDPFLTPRPGTPDDCPPVGQQSSTLATSATGETIQVFVQDPLLHETNPFGPTHSPIESTSTMDVSIHARRLRDSDLRKTRRESSDSLGSNFTVEEEARIQAQIVKNLDALDKERVMGEGDIVHIPQISEKRYSWEE